MKITKNIGGLDRKARFILGSVFLFIGLFFTSETTQIVMYVLAFIMILTASIKFCIPYALFGINTDSTDKGNN